MNTRKISHAKQNINKLPSGTWRVRIQKDGKKYNRVFKKLKEAKLWRNYIHQSEVL